MLKSSLWVRHIVTVPTASALSCPGGAGGSFSYGGASACGAGTFTGPGTVSPSFTSDTPAGSAINFGTIPADTTKHLTLNISNEVLDPGNLPDLTYLTLLDIRFSGPDGGLFNVPGFLDGTIVSDGGDYLLDISFSPLFDGSFPAR
jgi:hypothetical protein